MEKESEVSSTPGPCPFLCFLVKEPSESRNSAEAGLAPSAWLCCLLCRKTAKEKQTDQPPDRPGTHWHGHTDIQETGEHMQEQPYSHTETHRQHSQA